jgi:hypothetical protein
VALLSLVLLDCFFDVLVEAESLLRCALHILEVSLGPTHAEVATVLENLACLLHTTARDGEAQELEERAESIRSGK